MCVCVSGRRLEGLFFFPIKMTTCYLFHIERTRTRCRRLIYRSTVLVRRGREKNVNAGASHHITLPFASFFSRFHFVLLLLSFFPLSLSLSLLSILLSQTSQYTVHSSRTRVRDISVICKTFAGKTFQSSRLPNNLACKLLRFILRSVCLASP